MEWLNFLGINYRANNLDQRAESGGCERCRGHLPLLRINVSKLLKPGKENALAVEVFAPGKDDLGITWVDWNPTPPDKDMGIWKEVFLRSSGDVTVRNPFVSSKPDAEYKTAELTISGEVRKRFE